MRIAWNKGIKTHHIPWNKGKSLPKEICVRISKTLKGRMSGENNPMFGIVSPNKGKHPTEETLKRRSQALKGHLGMKGKDNPSWKGGITPIRHTIKTSSKYVQWRQDVFIRDNFTCQKCHKKDGGNLEAHHIKRFNILLIEAMEYMPLLDIFSAAMFYPPLWDLINGITYCKECHKLEHKKL